MKLIHRDNYKNYIISLVALILSAIAFPFLPEQIPVHFDARGVVDNYGSAYTIFLLPAVMFGVNALGEITKHVDPKASNYGYFSRHYYLFYLALNVFLFLVQVYLITYALELVSFNVTNVILVAMGVLFILIGNMMPKVKQNFFMGIKTPWTLADEYVWYETHRFCGKVWFVLGLVMCVGGFLPGIVAIPIEVTVIILGAFVPIVYSYLIYKRKASKE